MIRALLVEDNPDDVAMFSYRIAESGLKISLTHVASVGEALILDPNDVDLIWLDLNLPDSRGAATVARLREGFPRTPLIVLTGTADERIARNTLRMGAQDYVNKHQLDGHMLARLTGFSIERLKVEAKLDGILEEQDRVGSARHWVEEANFRDLYENAPVMFASVDHESAAILRCNERLATALGYERKELVGKSVFDLYTPECVDEVRLAFSEFITQGSVEFAELQLLHRDGHPIDVALSASSVLDEEGNVILSRACWIDISSRIIAEKALAQANLRLEERVAERTRQVEDLSSVAETTSDLIAICFLDGEISFLNRAGRELLGISQQDLDNAINVADIFTPEQTLRSESEVMPEMRRNGRWSGRFDMAHRATRSWTPLFWETFILRDPASHKATALAAVARDLTEEFKQREVLEKESERLSFTVEISGIGTWTWDAKQGTAIVLDDNMQAILGINQPILKNGINDILEFVHPDDRTMVRASLTDALKTGEASTTDYRIIRPDGRVRYIQARGGVHKNEQRQVQWGVGTIWDVTERRNMEEELRQLTIRDALTGLFNRRYLDDTLSQEWRRGARSKAEISLLMVDIDHFKNYNDQLGHQAGDECLRKVARVMASKVKRSADFVARYGGEEFAVVLTETGTERAQKMARRMCDAVRRAALPHPESSVGAYVTVSVGVHTAICDKNSSPEQLFSGADQALYEVKMAGRNNYKAATD